jgi:hypothetical protein
MLQMLRDAISFVTNRKARTPYVGTYGNHETRYQEICAIKDRLYRDMALWISVSVLLQ